MSMDFMKLPPTLQQRLMQELQPGEVVAWAGQPLPGRLMRQGFLLWLFFIPWTAFSLFWMSAASGFQLPNPARPEVWFALFGLPFLLIGLGGLASPFYMRRKAASTVYVITSKRAFTLTLGRSSQMHSWPPEKLGRVSRTEHGDGSGDLVFASEEGTPPLGRGFTALRDVRQAELYLNQLLARRVA
ncbi:MAG TPA: hypothetical protein VF050_04890 [Moraxellaceae bacterium]